MCNPAFGVQSVQPVGQNAIDNHTMTDKEWYQIYWNYFLLMSTQRMQMVHFYITIEVVLIGGFFALLQLEQRQPWVEYAATIAIAFISITFFGLDRRSKIMIHYCEDLMKKMEENYPNYKGMHPIHYINDAANGEFQMTYSKWFLVQYVVIGGFGVVCCFLLMLKIL